jgi:hypothetical protein
MRGPWRRDCLTPERVGTGRRGGHVERTGRERRLGLDRRQGHRLELLSDAPYVVATPLSVLAGQRITNTRSLFIWNIQDLPEAHTMAPQRIEGWESGRSRGSSNRAAGDLGPSDRLARPQPTHRRHRPLGPERLRMGRRVQDRAHRRVTCSLPAASGGPFTIREETKRVWRHPGHRTLCRRGRPPFLHARRTGYLPPKAVLSLCTDAYSPSSASLLRRTKNG